MSVGSNPARDIGFSMLGEAIQLAYKTSVVLLGVPAHARGAPEVFPHQ